MARTKSPAIRREPSEVHVQSNGVVHRDRFSADEIPGMLEKKLSPQGDTKSLKASTAASPLPSSEGFWSLFFSVGGIYASFLTWAVLQERITTTTYGPSNEKFTYSIFLNTIQSIIATISGLLYLYTSTSHPHKAGRPAPIFPSRRIFAPLLLISITSSLASPFGYASLKHIDYITFILAKSCKLLPVMALHLTIFRKKYPLQKYLVVALVTLGVYIFTAHNPSTAAKAAKHASKNAAQANRYWGMFLLSINLLMDGITNTTQDNIFSTFKPYSGPQMMCAQNIMSSVLTIIYLLAAPSFAPTAVGQYIGMGSGSELASAVNFIKQYPRVGWDVLGFAICGAVGQVFIFHTLNVFGSLLLVTVTVTRKMMTMLLSVMYFGHTITKMQWFGVGMVFSGIGFEAEMSRREKKEKARVAMQKVLSFAGETRKEKNI